SSRRPDGNPCPRRTWSPRATHGKRPMPAFCKLPLLLWCVGRGDDERGAAAQVRIGAVEPVRPQRAIGTALAHVVANEQIGLAPNSSESRTLPPPARRNV